MIQIGDVVVSFDVLREKFICNLDACKGACCVEGDAGAPVELDEIEKLDILIGFKTPADILFKKDVEEWQTVPHMNVILTVDKNEEGMA